MGEKLSNQDPVFRSNLYPKGAWLWVVFLLELCISSLALAEEKAAEIEEIVITANKIEESASEVSETIDRVTSQKIKDQALQTLPEALRDVSGLDVNSRGSARGEDIDFRLRGSDRDEVLLLLDGIPIHGNDEAKADYLNLLPTENIERVEILKGSQSVLYGSDAVGGVINIITKRGEPGKRFSFQQEVGNLSTFKETISGSGGSDRTQIIAAFSRTDQGGRGPNDRLGSNAFSAVFIHEVNEDFNIEVGSHLIDADQEIRKDQIILFTPAFTVNDYVVDDSNADRRFQVTTDFIKVENQWNERYNTRLTYGFNFIHEEVLNSNKEDSPVDETGAPLTPNSLDFSSHSYRHDIDLLNNIEVYADDAKEIDDLFQVGFNFTGEHLNFISNSLPGDTGPGLPFTSSFPTPGANDNRQNYAIYFQNIFKWKGLSLTGGMRFDHNSTFGDELSPRASVGYRIDKTNTKFFGTYSEGFHAPVIAEFFDAQVGGSPTAIPIKKQQELSQSYEAGVEQYLWNEKIWGRVVYFFIDYDRMLDLVQAIDDASSWGVETDLSIEPVKWLEVGGNYTYNRTHNDDDGTELTMRPRHRLNAFATVRPLKGLTIRADVNTLSSRLTPRIVSLTLGDFPVAFFDSNNRTDDLIAGHVNVDLAVRYAIPHNIKWIKEWEVFARGQNLLDDDWEESFGYPMPGVQVYGGTELDF